MGILDSIFGRRNENPDANIKRFLLGHLTIEEIKKVVKNYISENPKYYFTDQHGIERKRAPTRQEMESAIISQVPLEVMLQIHPKLKTYIDEEDEDEDKEKPKTN